MAGRRTSRADGGVLMRLLCAAERMLAPAGAVEERAAVDLRGVSTNCRYGVFACWS